MPASIFFPEKAAFIRVGDDHLTWGDPYLASLDCEILDDIGIIGGLDRELSIEQKRDVVLAVARAGLRPAVRRAKYDLENIRMVPMRRSTT